MLKKIYEKLYDGATTYLGISCMIILCFYEMASERSQKPYSKEEAEAAEKNFKAPICPECLNYLDSPSEKE